jgi:deaminated glutathione amidase
MASELSCAVVQLQSGDDVGANLQAVRKSVAAVAQRGAKLVVLPENFAFFGSEEARAAVAEDLHTGGGPIERCLSELCREHGVYIIGGGMPERSGESARPFNTSAVWNSAGQVIARYQKIHLFDVTLPSGETMHESRSTTPGDSAVVVDIEGFKVGLTVCYDLRFPMLFAELRRRGADVLVVPAAFTQQTGIDHWRPLLQARAIENQCWLLAAGQWGVHPRGRSTFGHSMVIDPWGTVAAESPNRVGFALASVDHESVRSVRARIPCFEHCRTPWASE